MAPSHIGTTVTCYFTRLVWKSVVEIWVMKTVMSTLHLTGALTGAWSLGESLVPGQKYPAV